MERGQEVAQGVWLAVEAGVLSMFVPRLFADQPIRVPMSELAVCRPEEIDEPKLAEGAEPLEVTGLSTGRREVNLLLVLARAVEIPRVRLRARLRAKGYLVHVARKRRPPDGYHFHCFDPDDTLVCLVQHGAEHTVTPYAWVMARRKTGHHDNAGAIGDGG